MVSQQKTQKGEQQKFFQKRPDLKNKNNGFTRQDALWGKV